jgi:hypothetical protein
VGFVVELVGVQAVMQLAEEPVEQMPLRLGVTVPVVPASPIMRVGSRRRAQRGITWRQTRQEQIPLVTMTSNPSLLND